MFISKSPQNLYPHIPSKILATTTLKISILKSQKYLSPNPPKISIPKAPTISIPKFPQNLYPQIHPKSSFLNPPPQNLYPQILLKISIPKSPQNLYPQVFMAHRSFSSEKCAARVPEKLPQGALAMATLLFNPSTLVKHKISKVSDCSPADR